MCDRVAPAAAPPLVATLHHLCLAATSPVGFRQRPLRADCGGRSSGFHPVAASGLCGGEGTPEAQVTLGKISLPGVFFGVTILRERLRKCCYERNP